MGTLAMCGTCDFFSRTTSMSSSALHPDFLRGGCRPTGSSPLLGLLGAAMQHQQVGAGGVSSPVMRAGRDDVGGVNSTIFRFPRMVNARRGPPG
eukprot:194478-Prymnesium_polylepis.1